MNFLNTMQVAIETWTFAFLIIIMLLGAINDLKSRGTVRRLLGLLFVATLLVGFDGMTYVFRYSEKSYATTIIRRILHKKCGIIFWLVIR